jgi:hypothetical protein
LVVGGYPTTKVQFSFQTTFYLDSGL